MAAGKWGLTALILRFVSGLRFPWLFGIAALVFGADLLFPDLLPFADELLLGLLTLLLGAWRKRKDTVTVASTEEKTASGTAPSHAEGSNVRGGPR
ncbi:MAG: DUF6116 family protein [Planctomycetota bacterium]